MDENENLNRVLPNIPTQISRKNDAEEKSTKYYQRQVEELEKKIILLQAENKFLKEKIFNAALKVF